MLKCNLGRTDRFIRFLIANAFFAYTWLEHGTLSWVAMFIGAIPMMTAIMGLCPLYYLLGINTCEQGKRE